MSIIDAISFVAALLFLLVSSRQRAKRRNETTHEENEEGVEAFEQQEERRIQELQEWIHGKVEPVKKQPIKKPPPPQRTPQPQASSKLNPGLAHSAASSMPLAPVTQKPRGSPAAISFELPEVSKVHHLAAKEPSTSAVHVLDSLKSPKEMVVMYEIFSPPKGL